MMAAFYGIIMYEIFENGNLLSGIYTNSTLIEDSHYHIDMEIARKVPNDNGGLLGTYQFRYTETMFNTITSGNLIITKFEEVYEFKWHAGEQLIWVGIGLMKANNIIAVAYTKP